MQVNIGSAYPLGASVTANGVNFAVASDIAADIQICLFHSDTEEQLHVISLPGKTGRIWHGEIHGLGEGQLYGIRVNGDLLNPESDKLLIDPYARRLSRPVQYNERQYEGDSQFMVAKSIVTRSSTESSTKKQRPAKPKVKPWKRIVYEAHVKGVSMLHPAIEGELQGTYLGAANEEIIDHIRSLNVTSVQFMPLFAFMPEPYITQKGLTNYWGYNPVCYFAPEPRYAISDAVQECKTMIDAYHSAGIEVIVDVVFNHTAEAGEGGPQLSLRGLMGQEVYLHTRDKQGHSHYANYSGCGNTVNVAHPFMFTLILDALRYWVEEMGVDGFRFDLAPGLGRDPHEFNRHSGLMKAISQDPLLRDVVLIAEPWDMGPMGYQLGAFPYPWLEVNDKYRDTIRGFWRGDGGLVGEFATRLMGSRDVFSKTDRPIYSSVNCVTYHDGFTLHDLVTYNDKHNLANGEDNRDGHNHNLSYNYGVEGETKQKRIIKLREKQKRNMYACLMFSQGTPHIVAGDELSKTQLGNNNAYCQDNELSWVNWSLDKVKQDFLTFCKYVAELRQSSKVLGNMQLDDDTFCNHKNVADVHWYKPDGTDKASVDWQQKHNRAFAVEIVGAGTETNHYNDAERWLFCVNAGDTDVRFHLPVRARYAGWRLKLDTRYTALSKQPDVCVQNVFLQQARSLVLFSFEQALTTKA